MTTHATCIPLLEDSLQIGDDIGSLLLLHSGLLSWLDQFIHRHKITNGDLSSCCMGGDGHAIGPRALAILHDYSQLLQDCSKET